VRLLRSGGTALPCRLELWDQAEREIVRDFGTTPKALRPSVIESSAGTAGINIMQPCLILSLSLTTMSAVLTVVALAVT
jgi:hypothetical protein